VDSVELRERRRHEEEARPLCCVPQRLRRACKVRNGGHWQGYMRTGRRCCNSTRGHSASTQRLRTPAAYSPPRAAGRHASLQGSWSKIDICRPPSPRPRSSAPGVCVPRSFWCTWSTAVEICLTTSDHHAEECHSIACLQFAGHDPSEAGSPGAVMTGGSSSDAQAEWPGDSRLSVPGRWKSVTTCARWVLFWPTHELRWDGRSTNVVL